MSCKIIAIDNFKRDAKKLLKKFVSLKEELAQLQADLLENPRMGTLVHKNTYKIRLAVKSKGKGKSGGMRVVTHVFEIDVKIDEKANDQNTIIFLLTIYDKSEVENIPDIALKSLIDEVDNELDKEA